MVLEYTIDTMDWYVNWYKWCMFKFKNMHLQYDLDLYVCSDVCVSVVGGMQGLQGMMRQFQQGAAGKFGNMFGNMDR